MLFSSSFSSRFVFLLLSCTLLLLLTIPSYTTADDHSHEYNDGEEVTFWFNKIGPYHNPQETYSYYSLPFCRPNQPKELREKSDSLGVVLEGDELSDSGLLVKFKEDQQSIVQCTLELSADLVSTFNQAVRSHYWYQMYIDELPVWGMVGEFMKSEESGKAQEQGFLYTHKEFSIAYNGNRIIEVNLTSDNPQPLTPGTTLSFTVSVHWKPTEREFDSRFDRYLDFDFFEHQIHWFSIFNSFMMVIFLCGLVALILMRTLKNDYARYTSEEESELELDRVVDESGWKQVHGDVFRAPRYLIIFAALIGTGFQLIFLALCVILFALIATMYDERGSATSAGILVYSLTSILAGYSSSRLYKQYGGVDWKATMVLTACLFPSLCAGIGFFLNAIAVYYQSTAAYSFLTILKIFCLWLLVTCPLVLLGTIIGRSTAQVGDFPCRVNSLRRPIPDVRGWYAQPLTMALFSGILPFGSIFIEMYFIFTSFWNYKFYYVYGFMFLVFLILLIVTVCVTIVSTYVLLNAEDYRWHWASFFSGGSTALYVFLYSIYYFFTKTRMSGVLQTCYYFGYMSMFCMGLLVFCGTIGYFGANAFIRRIYQYIKSD